MGRVPDVPEGAQGARGLVGWFDIFCSAEHRDTVLATGPDAPLTHWAQCWMPFERELSSPTEIGVGLHLAAHDESAPGLIELVVQTRIRGETEDCVAEFF